MKTLLATLAFCVICSCNLACAQAVIDREQFFKDTSLINATLKVNIGRLMQQRNKEGYLFPAVFSCKLGDSININDTISAEIRGHFRRDFSYLPPLKLYFNANANAVLRPLKSLKLVGTAKPTQDYDQYLLKEFITYKIYNLINERSFNVRLLNVNYEDSSKKKKTYTEHAFLLEDIKETAKRNGCKEWTKSKINAQQADRRQMTIVAIFEYMIGNTDWSVPAGHNIKLIESKKDSTAVPYVIPYDFDFSGLVGTDYSVPNETLDIESVKQRLYRGWPRTMEEINDVLDIFKRQKQNIYAAINNFKLLTPYTKRDMTDYLDGFYSVINDADQVRTVFVTNARTE